MKGLIWALLGPSPLARVHKVACIMGNLAALPGQQSTAELATIWLRSAMQELPPGLAGPQADSLTQLLPQWTSQGLLLWAACGAGILEDVERNHSWHAWGRIMHAGVQSAGQGSVSSYAQGISGRRLKKALRSFAEQRQTYGVA